MEDPMETASDEWFKEIPEPPTDLEGLRKEVRALMIYVKLLAKSNEAAWKQVIEMRKKLQKVGL